MAAKIEVAIADQNPFVRAGLESLVQRDGRFKVCGVHDSGTALIEALRAKPVEIAIVGWTLPDMTGGAVLARVKQEKWQTRIVIYTGERSNDVLEKFGEGRRLGLRVEDGRSAGSSRSRRFRRARPLVAALRRHRLVKS